MNTPVISREDILRAARELALAPGAGALSMRAVAQRCGIAVGSVYNYFPTKADLTIAVVSQVWQEIFHPCLCGGPEGDLLGLTARLAEGIRRAAAAYPGFFARHMTVIADKAAGRAAMREYSVHVEKALLQALLSDPAVRRDVWDDRFTPQVFASFVFDQLRADLLRGTDCSAFLEALIRRAVC